MEHPIEQAGTAAAVDPTDCDREPIHIPGSIQPHGVLLALDPATRRIARAGGATRALLDVAVEDLPGEDLATLFDASTTERLRAMLEGTGRRRPIYALGARRRDGRPLDVAAHLHEGVPIVEIEPCDGEIGDPLVMVQALVDRLQAQSDVAAYLEALAREIRAVSGFARVMVYRFEADDSGIVVAEDRREDLPPYLGLRYPASDIPAQARALYRRNWIRAIPDAAYSPAPILPVVEEPLDLGFSLLRSVSPIHLEYMANMGVRASMSLSIVIEGRLWGLVACHHDTPRRLSHLCRSACELAAQMVSLQLGEKLARAEAAERLRAAAVHAELFEALSREQGIAAALLGGARTLLDLVHADGAAVFVGGRIHRLGSAPSDAQIEALVGRLAEAMPEGVYATDRLAELHPPAAEYGATASGLLALSVSRAPRDYVLWFRPEVCRTVTWAGDPAKAVVHTAEGVRLSPRASFAAWSETVRGHAAPWTADELAAAQALRASILEVVLRRMDEIAREREAARARQDILIAELDHRVKNTLATIQSLVKYSAASAGSLEAFTRTVQMRLHAMARTHDLLTRARWEGADLAHLVELESAPYGGADRIAASGPAATLRPNAALTLSLALHELATNAAKYGALSRPEGRVDVRWSVDEATRRLVFVWSERGGPLVDVPDRRGFGRTLLERSLAFELDGRVTLDFAPQGLVCTAEIPLGRLVPAHDPGQAAPAGPSPVQEVEALSLAGRRILVVEDQALIAMEAQDTLEAAGAEVVGPFGRLRQAVAAAEGETLDAALIDVDLDGERSWPVADALARRGIPFAFTTGFQADIVFPERFLEIRVLSKPYPDDGLVGLARDLLGAPRATS